MRQLIALFLCLSASQAFARNCHSAKNCPPPPVSHYVALTWQDSEVGATFDLYRGACGNETLYQTAIPMTSYQDNNVVSGQTYCYFVTAVGASGTSGPSNEVQAVIPSP